MQTSRATEAFIFSSRLSFLLLPFSSLFSRPRHMGGTVHCLSRRVLASLSAGSSTSREARGKRLSHPLQHTLQSASRARGRARSQGESEITTTTSSSSSEEFQNIGKSSRVFRAPDLIREGGTIHILIDAIITFSFFFFWEIRCFQSNTCSGKIQRVALGTQGTDLTCFADRPPMPAILLWHVKGKNVNG